MTLMVRKSEEYLELVDHKKGLVDRSIFNDQNIYEMELERIFARSWNFMAHDTQIPNPGDFFMTRIGEDRVIVVRDNDGNPQTLINTCRTAATPSAARTKVTLPASCAPTTAGPMT